MWLGELPHHTMIIAVEWEVNSNKQKDKKLFWSKPFREEASNVFYFNISKRKKKTALFFSIYFSD